MGISDNKNLIRFLKYTGVIFNSENNFDNIDTLDIDALLRDYW
jgi:hypothetical protein